MTTREQNGRYTHQPSHAGYDAQRREWEICDHCLKFRLLGGQWQLRHPRIEGDGGIVYEVVR